MESIRQELRAVLSTQSFIVNSSQFSAFLFENFDRLNWAGFYFYIGAELVLGPFQGKVACSPIQIGKGVCGDSAKARKAILVEDVYAYPGHISCDSRSRSELVVPIIKNDILLGVFDMDSPDLARFNLEDLALVESLVAIFIESTNTNDLGKLS